MFSFADEDSARKTTISIVVFKTINVTINVFNLSINEIKVADMFFENN